VFLYKYVCCDLLVFSGGFVVLMMKKIIVDVNGSDQNAHSITVANRWMEVC